MFEAGNTVNRQVWGPWATAGFGFVISIAFLVTQVFVMVVFVAVTLVSDSTINPLQLAESLGANGLVIALSTFATTIVCVGLIMLITKLRRSVPVTEYLGFKPITNKTILVLLAITAGFIILSDSLSLILGRPLYPEYMVDVYNTSAWPVLLWIALVIFAPAFEETFFRGFLFTGFRQSRMGVAGTIVLTAFIWALMHVQYGLYEIAAIFILGIILGIGRLKTESLWSPFLMHAFCNLVAVLEVAFNVNALVS